MAVMPFLSDDDCTAREQAELYQREERIAVIRTGYVDEWLESDLVVEVRQ